MFISKLLIAAPSLEEKIEKLLNYSVIDDSPSLPVIYQGLKSLVDKYSLEEVNKAWLELGFDEYFGPEGGVDVPYLFDRYSDEHVKPMFRDKKIYHGSPVSGLTSIKASNKKKKPGVYFADNLGVINMVMKEDYKLKPGTEYSLYELDKNQVLKEQCFEDPQLFFRSSYAFVVLSPEINVISETKKVVEK